MRCSCRPRSVTASTIQVNAMRPINPFSVASLSGRKRGVLGLSRPYLAPYLTESLA